MTDQGRLANNRKWVLDKIQRTADVACGSCNACCFNKAVFLYVDAGDDPLQYQTELAFNQFYGLAMPMLQHRDDGGCVYLTDRGCSIHTNRPAACRAYSCADQHALYTRADRRRLKRGGKWGPEQEAGERQWQMKNSKTTT